MKDIFQYYFKENYFTDPIGLIVCLIGLIILFANSRHKQEFNIFKFYFLFFILLKIYTYYHYYAFFNQLPYASTIHQIFRYMDFAFTIFEYFVFTFYLRNMINKKLLMLSIAFFSCSVIIIFIGSFLLNKFMFNSSIFSSQAIALLIICFSYYYKIYKFPIDNKLSDEPSFWIVTGLTIFMACTLPYSLISDQFYIHNWKLHVNIFSLFFVFYILLYVMIIKAYLCQRVTTK